MDNRQKQDILRYAELSCREQRCEAEQRPHDAEESEEMTRLLVSLGMSHEQVIDQASRSVMQED